MPIGGLAVLGSLLWDDSPNRKRWRKTIFTADSSIEIPLPVRYGRISKSRNCTFTMVLDGDTEPGKSQFLRFKEEKSQEVPRVISALISAEINQDKYYRNSYWSWGCIGYLINPKSSHAEELTSIFDKRYNDFKPKDYNSLSVRNIIDSNGKLNIDWPDIIPNVDYLLCTLTKPNVDSWPTPKLIALKMIVNNYDEYFKENLKNDLNTYQDNEIMEFLNSIKIEDI